MLITKVKPLEEIDSITGKKPVAVCCEGCSELHYPESDVKNALNALAINRTDITVIALHYACNLDILRLNMQKYSRQLCGSDTVLVFACGVGVQSVSEVLGNKHVIAACDTYPLPGCQGLTPSEYDCVLCGECHLNETAGICPVTACAKGLTNGQCGGAKNGMCEVEANLECAWESINERLAVLMTDKR